jgi:hypothetical protein
MTLPPEKIGDKGQRYELRMTGYPKDEESVIGWGNDKAGLTEVGVSLGKAPGATSMRVVDRTGAEPDFTRYFGALR